MKNALKNEKNFNTYEKVYGEVNWESDPSGKYQQKTCILHFPGIRKLEIAKNREKKNN